MGTHAGITWDAQPLGRVPDQDLARRLGVTPGSVRQARYSRGIPAMPRGRVERLGAVIGEEPDAIVAHRLGLPEHCVRDARRRAGLRSRFNPAVPSVDWPAIRPHLGKMPDIELARHVGVSAAAIHAERVRLGIAKYRPYGTCPCGREFAGSFRWQRYCRAVCGWAAKAARDGRTTYADERVAVALAALRREIRRRS